MAALHGVKFAISGYKRPTAFVQLPLEDCASFLEEFACEVVVHDDHNRTIKYTHPESQPDDALHSTNYALLMAVRSQARG
jgi:hypothetical protein